MEVLCGFCLRLVEKVKESSSSHSAVFSGRELHVSHFKSIKHPNSVFFSPLPLLPLSSV